jgi:hypothetical protein
MGAQTLTRAPLTHAELIRRLVDAAPPLTEDQQHEIRQIIQRARRAAAPT